MQKSYQIKENGDWKPLTTEEFNHFVNSPKGKDRFFINFGDFLIEAEEEQFREWKKDKNYTAYIKRCNEPMQVLPIFEAYCAADDCFEDDVLEKIQKEELQKSLNLLNEKERWLIEELFFIPNPKTESEIADVLGIHQSNVNRRKKNILRKLKTFSH